MACWSGFGRQHAYRDGDTAIDRGKSMKTIRRRRVMAVALSLIAAVGGVLVAGTAHALPMATGSLSFSGDRQDSVSRGMSYSYSTSNGDTFVVVDGDALIFAPADTGVVHIAVDAANGDRWSLVFIAPSGQVLTPGTYTVTHNPSTGDFRPGPGLDLSGNGVACGNVIGSFTITQAVFGAGGFLESFDATFEQQCVGATSSAAARGEVHISNPGQQPAPTPTRTTTAATPPSIDSSSPAPPGSTMAGTQPSIAATSSPTGEANLLSEGTFGTSLLAVWVGVGAGVVLFIVLLAVSFVVAVRRQ
jgi:hypothetical protein